MTSKASAPVSGAAAGSEFKVPSKPREDDGRNAPWKKRVEGEGRLASYMRRLFKKLEVTHGGDALRNPPPSEYPDPPKDQFDFPPDPERWHEEDLQEIWDWKPPFVWGMGWEKPLSIKRKNNVEAFEGHLKDHDATIPPPYYLPYYKFYPIVAMNNYDVTNPKEVVEELDRIEEFLNWVSFIFKNGSSYEGTVWEDFAHGKGVYVSKDGLIRYEGEWFRNVMEGHGVVELDIPEKQPLPGSNLEAKMRAEGKIIKRDYMNPRDQRWLDMDIEDSLIVTDGRRVTPFYEKKNCRYHFGRMLEKGRYKYAGQWKHGRMHGCGVFEVNERISPGRFYFGKLLSDPAGCDFDVSAMHAGIAEIAAAKARMFVNKPDGMVREAKGPYGDPQHPYLYDEEDVWMAPGFINQFHEAPDYWKAYVEEVDQEREMWLNSFYKAPLRIPMPAELEYWWKQEGKTHDIPEFICLNKPERDPEDPSKIIYTDDPLIFHTKTGRIINYVDDEKFGVRLFWQPMEDDDDYYDTDDGTGEDGVNLEHVDFLPLGFDDFYGKGKQPKVSLWNFLVIVVGRFLNELEMRANGKKKTSEMNIKLLDEELEQIETEICLEEEMADIESEIKRKQKEDNERARKQVIEVSPQAGDENAESDEEDEADEETPSDDDEGVKDDTNGKNSKSFPFSSLSLSLGSYSVPILVPTKIREMCSTGSKIKHPRTTKPSLLPSSDQVPESTGFVSLGVCPQKPSGHMGLRTTWRQPWRPIKRSHHRTAPSQLDVLAQILSTTQALKEAASHHGGLHDTKLLPPMMQPISSSELDSGISPLSIQSLNQLVGLSKFLLANKPRTGPGL